MTSPASQGSAAANDLIEHGASLVRAGRVSEAEAYFREALHHDPNAVPAHAFIASIAFRGSQYHAAALAYERCVQINPSYPDLWFNLATAREKTGDIDGAVDAYLRALHLNPKDARIALFTGAALEAAGRREDAAMVFSLGNDIDPAFLAGMDRADAHPEVRFRAITADRVIRRHFTQLHADSVAESAGMSTGHAGAPAELARVINAIWVQTHDKPFTYGTRKHEPSIFYMPDLEARTITPREALPWVAAVESATEVIRNEYLAAASNGAQFAPYVEQSVSAQSWRELRGNTDWSSIHLFKAAQEAPNARLFPRTLQALEAADIVRVEGGTPIELFFSRLKPGTHIPPHYGACNNRLTVHLPLIVPEACAIRVRDDVHAWREGEIFAFDDSFEHEAWNRSDRDRVVLIFESHHPELSTIERFAIERAFEARGRWLKHRRIPPA
ncbi:MAG: aspartyl/asparaginyl beta-hydroxylase domain-containing protein [Steroidobacteraceae bacterium]